MQLFDKDGNAVESFTQDDVDTQLEEQKTGFNTTISEKDKEIGSLNTTLSELQKSKKDSGDDGEGGDSDITEEELQEKIKAGVDAGLKQINEDRNSTAKKSMDAKLEFVSNGDKELRARVEAELNLLDGLDMSVDDKISRATSFIKSNDATVDFADIISMGTGAGVNLRHNSVDNDTQSGKVSDSVRSILKKSGSSEQTIEKNVSQYETDLSNNNQNK